MFGDVSDGAKLCLLGGFGRTFVVCQGGQGAPIISSLIYTFLRLTTVVLMLCALAISRSASAQSASGSGGAGQGANPRETARHRAGFVYFNPSLSIDRLGYDSNVQNTSSERQGDFTVSITPHATLWIPFQRRALLTSNASVGFDYYKDVSRNRTVNPRIDALGELYARRLTFFAEAGRSNQFRQPNIEIETRVKERTDNLGGGIRVTLQRGLSIGVSAYRRDTAFDGDDVSGGVSLSERLDRSERGVRVIVQERLTSLTTVGVVFETREDRFDRAPNRNADGYRAAATIAFDEKALINGSVALGYRNVDAADPLVPAFSGFVSQVAISNRIGGTTEVSLGWDRDTQYSLSETRPYFLTNAMTVRLRRQVAGEFDASAGVGRNRSTYRSEIGVAVPGGDGETAMTYSADVGYRVNRSSRAAFGVTHTRRTSALSDSRRYASTFAGFSLTYVF